MTIEENMNKLNEIKREYIHSYLQLILNIFTTYPLIKSIGLQSLAFDKIKLSRVNEKTVNLVQSGRAFDKTLNIESFLIEYDLKLIDLDIIPNAIYQDDRFVCEFIWGMSDRPIMMRNKFTPINEEIVNQWIEKLKVYDLESKKWIT